jgi:hypothetical protein
MNRSYQIGGRLVIALLLMHTLGKILYIFQVCSGKAFYQLCSILRPLFPLSWKQALFPNASIAGK